MQRVYPLTLTNFIQLFFATQIHLDMILEESKFDPKYHFDKNSIQKCRWGFHILLINLT